MHELSLAHEICRMARDVIGDAPADSVSAVGVCVGAGSGVEAANLAFCLEALLDAPPFAGARVVLTQTPDDTLRLDYVEVDDERPSHRRP